MKIPGNSGSFIVGFDFTNQNNPILIVGTQDKGKMDIVNAFQGPDALHIYHELVTKKEALK